MTDKNVFTRRGFLKLGGLAAMSVPAISVAKSFGGYDIVTSEEEYGGFLVRRHTKKNPPYEVNDAVYKRYDLPRSAGLNKNGFLDHFRRKQNLNKNIANKVTGFTRLEAAFAGGASSFMAGLGVIYSFEPLDYPHPLTKDLSKMPPWNPGEYGLSAKDVSNIVKKAAKFYGASMAGIAEVDERWFYNTEPTSVEEMITLLGDAKPDLSRLDPEDDLINLFAKTLRKSRDEFITNVIFSGEVDKPMVREDGTKVIPKSMRHMITMAFEMDYDCMETQVSGLALAAAGSGYSRMAFTSASLAEFIRALGYNAMPMGNSTSLSVPCAIDAGLGEMSRIGILVTPKYGPRIRIAKVLTDLPLVPDSPISFGVREFCEICGKCAKYCPGQVIEKGGQSFKPFPTGNAGVKKWQLDGNKCYSTWADFGAVCHTCIMVCPFNKPEGWVHEATRILIGARSGSIDKILLKLDDASGYGVGKDPGAYWKKNNFMHIKS
jgi:reductive dehalogenase